MVQRYALLNLLNRHGGMVAQEHGHAFGRLGLGVPVSVEPGVQDGRLHVVRSRGRIFHPISVRGLHDPERVFDGVVDVLQVDGVDEAADARLRADTLAGVDIEVDALGKAGVGRKGYAAGLGPFYSCSVEVPGEVFSGLSGVVDSEDGFGSLHG